MSTLTAITDKVHASGISKVALGPEEIRSIIQTLMYDGRVEEVRSVRLTPGVRQSGFLLVYCSLTERHRRLAHASAPLVHPSVA